MLINQAINNLKHLTELNIQNNWLFSEENTLNPPLELSSQWKNAKVNEKEYLVWEKGNKVRWFAQKIIIPHSLTKYPLQNLSLRIALTWWAESAQIFINEQLVCEGDLFDSSSRILITKNAQPNQEFIISLRLTSPSHDIGGLMFSRCLYENPNGFIDPSFFANELTILDKYIKNFYPQKEKILEDTVNCINWSIIKEQNKFNNHLTILRENLLPLSKYIKQRNFYLLGHAHLDMAWLWTIEETYEVAQRTFNSVLNLQKKHNNLTFGHTTAYLYQWIENNQPSLFKQIQKAVKNKTWEILGGMWVEPEVNLISGESLVRQLLYGQQYFLEKFGKYNTVAWLPDSFGFPCQLPQILKLGEIKYFVTGKLHWNDTNKFPHGCFWWCSPDGSRIFTTMSPPNITGIMDTNPITMSNYSVDWEKQTGLQDIFWLPGVGDHGGGPTHDMLEVIKRYDDSPFFPNVCFTHAEDYLNKISSVSAEKFPVWDQDLYLELHRGCYTTHAEQKYFNRYGESLLYQAELFSTITDILIKQNKIIFNKVNNNQKQINELWKKVLLNQFHDILPGTSINQVFVEANQLWSKIIKDAKNILDENLNLIALSVKKSKISLPEDKTLVIFNSLNWARSEIIEIDVDAQKYYVADFERNILKTQISADNKLLFLADQIPSVGYKEYLLIPKNNIHSQNYKYSVTNNLNNDIDQFQLINQYIQGKIDSNTGNLVSVYDLINDQEYINGEGNQLQLFQDKGQYWDAWNIDPNYENYPLNNTELVSIKYLEKGNLRQVIQVTKKYNQSFFIQEYILHCNSPIIYIKNKINWQENNTLLKVNFPLNFVSETLNYEVACGVMQQPTNPKTPQEKAKWEICAHHWADLGNDSYGVSILNNCKYGYDAKPNQIRLSLLRSPKWPDSQSDMGYHEFIYGFYPHQGNYRDAKTIQKGYELNNPLQSLIVETKKLSSTLPSEISFINLEPDNLVLMAFKTAEKDPNSYILRFYESHHQNTEFKFKNSLNLNLSAKVNLLENNIGYADNINKVGFSSISTYQIEEEKLSND